jgi:hypothetical protein
MDYTVNSFNMDMETNDVSKYNCIFLNMFFKNFSALLLSSTKY